MEKKERKGSSRHASHLLQCENDKMAGGGGGGGTRKKNWKTWKRTLQKEERST